jgi:hypothetical protein
MILRYLAIDTSNKLVTPLGRDDRMEIVEVSQRTGGASANSMEVAMVDPKGPRRRLLALRSRLRT